MEGGSFELEVPYSDQTEIAMDTLRQGDQVAVLAPAALVSRVHSRLEAAATQYRHRHVSSFVLGDSETLIP